MAIRRESAEPGVTAALDRLETARRTRGDTTRQQLQQ
jgi:hypothetical protein